MPLNLGSMNLEERKKYLALKAQYGKKLAPWYKKWWGVLIIVIIGIVLTLGTAAGFYIFDKIKEYQTEANNQNNPTQTAEKIINSGNSYFLGTDKPVVTIVEFSDFACPYCAKAHTILKKIINRYPGKIKIVYRDLPLHENSIDLSMAARCAGEQNMFWEMHDQLYVNQDSLTATGDDLKTIIYSLAGSIGLNAATFDSCYQEKKYLSDIRIDYADANTLSLKGTPSWFINNKLISGYIPEEDFLKLLDTYLASLK